MNDLLMSVFGRFVEEQSSEAFLALRKSVVESEDYNPYGFKLDSVLECIEAGTYDEAQSRLQSLASIWLACPEYHRMFAFILKKVGNAEGEDFERHISKALLRAILETGDGSRGRPYLVCRKDDEMDVISHLRLRPLKQCMISDDTTTLDCVECTDGKTIWFNISDMWNASQRLLAKSE